MLLTAESGKEAIQIINDDKQKVRYGADGYHDAGNGRL